MNFLRNLFGKKQSVTELHADSEMERARTQIVALLSKAQGVAINDLVPSAKQIITAELAKRAEESLVEASSLVGYNPVTFAGKLTGVPVDITNPFLILVLLTVESWLGPNRSENVRWAVSTAGSYFCGAVAQVCGQEQRWADSERYIRKDIEYQQLLGDPTAGLVVTLVNLGMAVYLQKRTDEARQIFQEALTTFALVPATDAQYNQAKSMLENTKRYL